MGEAVIYDDQGILLEKDFNINSGLPRRRYYLPEDNRPVKSSVDNIILASNPTLDKKLKRTTQKIGKEKIKCSEDLLWNQRNFFVKHVLDGDFNVRLMVTRRHSVDLVMRQNDISKTTSVSGESRFDDEFFVTSLRKWYTHLHGNGGAGEVTLGQGKVVANGNPKKRYGHCKRGRSQSLFASSDSYFYIQTGAIPSQLCHQDIKKGLISAPNTPSRHQERCLVPDIGSSEITRNPHTMNDANASDRICVGLSSKCENGIASRTNTKTKTRLQNDLVLPKLERINNINDNVYRHTYGDQTGITYDALPRIPCQSFLQWRDNNDKNKLLRIILPTLPESGIRSVSNGLQRDIQIRNERLLRMSKSHAEHDVKLDERWTKLEGFLNSLK